ncbi:MAG TPA: hypothetical protein VHY91_02005 [Pirellulales bacterium]|jgi:hypothetical protein|nr:hypothetical protein [Pirellulales bacterium]
MLKHLVAVLTASVSFAGCGTAPNGAPAGHAHTVNRPISGEAKDTNRQNGTPSGQAGSATTTQPAVDRAAAEARTTDTATGIGGLGAGNTDQGTSARGSVLDESPARGTAGP